MAKKMLEGIDNRTITLHPAPRTIGDVTNIFNDLYPELSKQITGCKSAGMRSGVKSIIFTLCNGPMLSFVVRKNELEKCWIAYVSAAMFPSYVHHGDCDIGKVNASNYKGIYATFQKSYPELFADDETCFITGYEKYRWTDFERGIMIHTKFGNDIRFVLSKDPNGEGGWKFVFPSMVYVDKQFLEQLGYGLTFKK